MSRVVYKFTALRIYQRSDVPLYVFGVDGRLVHQFAAVNFADRAADGVLSGYQRGKVSAHINQITNYLTTDGAMLPNAVVLALDRQVEFQALPGATASAWGTPGTLSIPLPDRHERKPALIVDGQQRITALSKLPPTRKFPVVVVGFVASSELLQRQQFILVNKTRPLPRDLINELLPHVGLDGLPGSWHGRQVAAQVLECLRFDPDSPFFGRIKGIGSSGEGVSISQAALLSVIGKSARHGVLKTVAAEYESNGVVKMMAHVVETYFLGAARVWPDAWEGSPRTSRLVHGVGLAAMGNLMDLVMEDVNLESNRAVSSVEHRLRKIRRRCAWTDGRWPKPLDCPWDGLQNTSQDKRRLSIFLEREYMRRH